MMFLQNERVRRYPQSQLSISYATLRSRLHLKMKLNIMKRDLEQQLKELVEKKVVVESYTFGTNALIIYLLPFTKLEKILYKIDNDGAEGTLLE